MGQAKSLKLFTTPRCSELQSNEARELEQHSDAVLSNTLRAINEDVQLIDASISAIQTQIEGISEPEQIVTLLGSTPRSDNREVPKTYARHLTKNTLAGEI